MNFQCLKSATRCFCKGTIIPILPLYQNIQKMCCIPYVETRLKVVSASKGGRNAKYFCQMYNQTFKGKFADIFSLIHQAVQYKISLWTYIHTERGCLEASFASQNYIPTFILTRSVTNPTYKYSFEDSNPNTLSYSDREQQKIQEKILGTSVILTDLLQ